MARAPQQLCASTKLLLRTPAIPNISTGVANCFPGGYESFGVLGNRWMWSLLLTLLLEQINRCHVFNMVIFTVELCWSTTYVKGVIDIPFVSEIFRLYLIWFVTYDQHLEQLLECELFYLLSLETATLYICVKNPDGYGSNEILSIDLMRINGGWPFQPNSSGLESEILTPGREIIGNTFRNATLGQCAQTTNQHWILGATFGKSKKHLQINKVFPFNLLSIVNKENIAC